MGGWPEAEGNLNRLPLPSENPCCLLVHHPGIVAEMSAQTLQARLLDAAEAGRYHVPAKEGLYSFLSFQGMTNGPSWLNLIARPRNKVWRIAWTRNPGSIVSVSNPLPLIREQFYSASCFA
jgi:hypothetical protein